MRRPAFWLDLASPLLALVCGVAIGISGTSDWRQATAGATAGFGFGVIALFRAASFSRRERRLGVLTRRLEEMQAVYAMPPAPEGCAVFGIVELEESGTTWRAVVVERQEGTVTRSSSGDWPTRLAAFEMCAILVEDVRREHAQNAEPPQ